MKLIIFTLLVVISAFLLRDKFPNDLPTFTSDFIKSFEINKFSSLLNDLFFSPSFVQVNLYKNGMEESVQHKILFNESKPFSEVQWELGQFLVKTVKVYNEVGEVINHFNQLSPSLDIFVAINDELFMHPGKYVGYNRTVGNYTMITLSLSPRVFLVKNFLSFSECDEITKEAATYEFTHRSVVYQENGEDVSTTRTSSTAYVPYPDYLVERSFNLTRMPDDVSYLYPDYHLQVIHYNPHQYFHPHHDGFFIEAVGDERWFEQAQRNRYLTLYLNDVEEGGETAFIEYDDYVAFYEQADNNNPCDKSTVKMTPSKGDGILFYNLKPGGQMNGEIDWSAVHTGCGVKTGEKWACNIWMYNRPTTDPEYVEIMREVGLLKTKGVQEAPAEAPGGPDLDPQHQQQDQQPIDIGVVEP